MTSFEPWRCEPEGEHIAYMLRFNWKNGGPPVSGKSPFLWEHYFDADQNAYAKRHTNFYPRWGYVEADGWAPASTNQGLYGILHGIGWGAVFYALEHCCHEFEGQVCAVDVRELDTAYKSVRAPRCWIVTTGDLEHCLRYLIPSAFLYLIKQGGVSHLRETLVQEDAEKLAAWAYKLGFRP